jgi:hypothetical protein
MHVPPLAWQSNTGNGGAGQARRQQGQGPQRRDASPPKAPARALSEAAKALQKELSLPTGSPVSLVTNEVSAVHSHHWSYVGR